MKKRVLSLVLAMLLTVGVYFALPSKVNPLPTPDVLAANYAGAYKCKKAGTVKTVNIVWNSNGTISIKRGTYYFYPSNIGQVFTLDDCGNYGKSGVILINMQEAISNGYLERFCG
ncbi:MAG: hypothetical protein J6U23_14225 [Clostridiales bacterium]|nr:hypothetical protein [Clostridiales bacterium]